MKNTGDFHNKTVYFLEMQNQISHYNKLLKVKPQVSLTSVKKHSLHSRLKTKYANTVQRQRIRENTKLLEKLYEIKKSKGILNEGLYTPKKQKISSMLSQYKTMQSEKQRIKQNQFLVDKLKKIKPQIGTCYEWDSHFNNFKNQQRKLSKVNSEMNQLEEKFYSTFSQITRKEKILRATSSSKKVEFLENLKKNTLKMTQKNSIKQKFRRPSAEIIKSKNLYITQNQQNNKQQKTHTKQQRQMLCTQQRSKVEDQQQIKKQKNRKKRNAKLKRQIQNTNTQDKINQIKIHEFEELEEQQNLKMYE